MALRNIITVGDPVLRKVSRKVEKFDDRLSQLLDDMAETMYKAPGVGLAAVQVGVLRRVVTIDVGDGLMELVNPEITNREGEQECVEGCLSVPGESGVLHRPETVTVKAQNRHGEWMVFKAHGFKASCVCHELDHLDGILYTDKMIRRATQADLEK